jgi:hypothetical protein
MKKQLLALCGLLIFSAGAIKAQLSGPYSVPGSYTSVAAAVIDLNTQGISGPVTINISAGYTETAPMGGISLTITGTAANPIIFQKSGVGANPLITAPTGTAVPNSAVQDGIWSFVGSDYITVDGIDLVDPNTTNPATMEYGYGFFKLSATDGCQNNTIQNCVITLNRVNNAAGSGPAVDGSRGIDVVNALITAHTTNVTITAATGANSNNKFYSNTIQNCNIGISMIGFLATSPFTNGDTGNDIGGSSSATGNMIINFGGAAAATLPASGVRTLNQYGLNVSYNTINNNTGSGVNHVNILRGVTLGTAQSANATVSNNTITLKSGATTSSMCPIDNASGATASNNAINISNNLITNCTYATSTSGAFVGILSSASAATLNISNNSFVGNSTSATSGTHLHISNTGAVTSAISINSNIINGFIFNLATGGTFNQISNSGGTNTSALSISSNSFQAITHSAAASTAYNMIVNTAATLSQNISNNRFINLNLNTSGGVTFIGNSVSLLASGTQSVIGNSIITGFNKAAGGTVILFTSNASSAAGSQVTHINNNFSNITLTGATTMSGWSNTDGGSPTKNISGNIFSNWSCGTSAVTCLNVNFAGNNTTISSNTVSNITSNGAITGIQRGASGSGAIETMSNNLVTGLTSASPGGAVTGITASGASFTNYSIISNTVNALSSVGASAVNGMIISGGTNVNAYKNKIYDLQSNNASGSVNGLLLSGGTTINTYNNLIGDLRAPLANAANPLNGINITGGTTQNLSYNSVDFNATSSGALFGSSAILASTTPNVNLRNNIFVNNSTANGAGFTVAYRRSTNTIGTYSASSNNNLFYAGTPSASNLLYYDNTTGQQTLAGLQAAVSPRDAASVTENPPFVSIVGSNPNFLNINTSTPTLIESGASPIASISDDYIGTLRNATTPDIGAWEGNYTIILCSGTPSSGIAVASPSTGCPSSNFNLNGTAISTGAGISYQWYSSPSSSGPWTAIPTATNSSYITNTTTVTFYQLVTTCMASAMSATSSPASFTPVNCYTMGNTTVTTCSGFVYDSGGPSLDYQNSENYTLTLVPSTTGAMASYTFNSFNTESGFDFLTIYDGNSTSAPQIGQYSGTTLPPAYTATNNTGILTFKFTSDPSITKPGWQFNVSCVIPPGCSGTPNSGTTAVSPSSGCSNLNFTLSSSGLSSGLGIDYQWYSSPSATGPWSAITSATNTSLLTNTNTITFYQLVTTCSVSAQSATSSVSSFTPTGPCYTMANTTITTCSGTLYDSGGPFAAYQNSENYTLMLVPSTANAMASYTFNTFSTESGFDYLYIYDGNSTSAPLVGQYNGSTIPPAYTATNSTGILTFKFTSDGSITYPGFDVSLSCVVPPMCSGTPNSGTAAISSPTGCPSFVFNLSATGTSTGTGISYQWYSSPSATGPWSAIPGATITSYNSSTTTTTYYQMETTCSVSAQSATTSVVSYSVINPGPCVCAGYLSSGATSTADEEILNITFGSLSNTSNCTTLGPGPGSIQNRYSNYSGFLSAPVVLQGQSVPFSFQIGTCGGNYGNAVAAYIDYNQNGSFADAGEQVYVSAASTNGPHFETGTILIPMTASVGVTRMRIVNVETSAPSSITDSGTYTWGETEDYCIDIQVPQPCAGAPNSGTAAINTPTGCISDPFNLTANGVTNAIGITYQWYSAPSSSGPWSSITSATNTTYSTTAASVIFFQMVTTCSNSAMSATTSIVSYTPFQCYTMSNQTITSCTGSLYDSGGPMNAYQNNEDYTLTIVPSAANNSVMISFSTFSLESNFDYLYIYDGNSTAAPLIGQYTGNSLPPNAMASNAQGILTLRFTSDISITYSGFSAALSCSNSCAGPPSAPAASGSVICSGNSTTLTTVATGTAMWYATSTPTSPIATGSVFVTPTLTSNTTYYVSDSTICGNSSLTPVTISVTPLPNVLSVTSGSICSGNSTTISAAVTGTAQWFATSTPTAPLSTNTLYTTPILNNTTTYYVRDTSSCGASSMTPVTVTVVPTPTVSINASPSSVICSGKSVILTASGANSYTWNTSANSAAINPTLFTSTNFSVIASSTACAGSYTASIFVTVNSNPTVNVLSSPSASICAGNSATLTASGAIIYAWSTSATTQSIAVSPSVTTVYTVIGTGANSCTTATQATLTINPKPIVTLGASSNTACLMSAPIALFGSPAGGVYSGPNVTANSLNPTATGTFTPMYSYTNSAGCTNTAVTSIVVSICNGIASQSARTSSLRVYPNPNFGTFTVETGNDLKKTIELTDVTGRIVRSLVTTEDTITIDITELSNGLYQMSIHSENGVDIIKVVKQ